MKTNEKITSAIIIALGIIVMGFALRSGIVTFNDMDRSVSVYLLLPVRLQPRVYYAP